MIIPTERCREIVKTFRKVNEHYPKLWSAMELMLYRLKDRIIMNYKCLTTTKDSKIILPNGLYLNYPGLTATYDEINEQYFDFKYYTLEEQEKLRNKQEVKGHKLYGGLLTENVVQALARVIVADQMLTIAEQLRVVTMTHDEVVCIVKETEVEQAKTFMIETMRRPPDWCTDLPLNAKIEYGERYG